MTDLNTSTEVTQTTEPAIAVETVLAPVFIYEFLYNSDCCESAAATISVHKTKEGAESALKKHKESIHQQWLKNKETDKDDPEYYDEFPYDFDQWWGIKETELLP